MLDNRAKVFFRGRHTWRLDGEGRGWPQAGFHMGMRDTKKGNVSLKVAVLSWLSWFSSAWQVSNSVSTLPRSILQDSSSCGGSGGIRPRFQPSPRLGLHAAYWKLLAVSVQWYIPLSCSKRWKDLGAGLSFKNGYEILLFLFTRSEHTRNCSNNQALNSLHWHLLSNSTTQHRPSEPVVPHASANWVCSSVGAASALVQAAGEGSCLRHQPFTIASASDTSKSSRVAAWAAVTPGVWGVDKGWGHLLSYLI